MVDEKRSIHFLWGGIDAMISGRIASVHRRCPFAGAEVFDGTAYP